MAITAAIWHGSPSQRNTAASSPSSASPGITCANIDSDLATVVNDLQTMDARYQEAWVTGGDSQDLQALINDTQTANGSDTLNSNAQTFNSDATTYLSDNDPVLEPGWQSGYSQVTDDIKALAQDCGRPTAPSNNPGNS